MSAVVSRGTRCESVRRMFAGPAWPCMASGCHATDSIHACRAADAGADGRAWVEPSARAICSGASAESGSRPIRRRRYTVIEIKRGGFSRGYTVRAQATASGARSSRRKRRPRWSRRGSSGASATTSRRSITCAKWKADEGRRRRTRSCRRASARRSRISTASTRRRPGRTIRTRSSARGS